MSEKEYVYAIHEGSIYEGGGVSEIFRNPETAIKFAWMKVIEENKKVEKIHGRDANWKDDYEYKEYISKDLSPFILKIWKSTISEIIIYKYELK